MVNNSNADLRALSLKALGENIRLTNAALGGSRDNKQTNTIAVTDTQQRAVHAAYDLTYIPNAFLYDSVFQSATRRMVTSSVTTKAYVHRCPRRYLNP
jgi:hypothetical protein